ncbi:MAG: hypothetical protein IH950_07470 [Bacteroidetes bacterium]|nr:hypothetical protein [Bacteroidota bacterium]
MKRGSYLSFFLSSLILISSCSIWRFNINDETPLQIGVTNFDDIEDHLSRPREIITVMDNGIESIIYKYYYNTSIGKYAISRQRQLNLEYIDGVLNGYLFSDSIDPEKTYFDEKLVSKIIIGDTNKDGILKIFGKPPSTIMLPSNLLHISLEIEESYEHPTKAKYTWIYGYQYLAGISPATMTWQYKFIIIFFDANDIVVDSYYINNIIYPLL